VAETNAADSPTAHGMADIEDRRGCRAATQPVLGVELPAVSGASDAPAPVPAAVSGAALAESAERRLPAPAMAVPKAPLPRTARVASWPALPAMRSFSPSIGRVALLYLLAIAGAELVIVALHPLVGQLCHILLLGTLLTHTAHSGRREQRGFLLALMLAPLIRIVSLGLPLASFPPISWYGLTSVPLFVGTALVIRALGLTRQEIGLQLPAPRHWLPTLAVACSGIPIGIIEYEILRPARLVEETTFRYLALAVVVLLVGTGVLEELLFRGVLQQATARVSSTLASMVYVSVLFAVLHAGHGNIVDVLFVFGVAMYFAAMVRSTHTLLGVAVAHGVTNIMLFLVLPPILS
jgi:membrane protease YdiL (CAAX protease family)